MIDVCLRSLKLQEIAKRQHSGDLSNTPQRRAHIEISRSVLYRLQTTMDPENVDDAKDCKGPLLGQDPPKRRSSRSAWFDLLKRSVELINALLVLILLGTLIHLLVSQGRDGRIRTMDHLPKTSSFGADRRYMSLDPKHDIMWETYSGEFAAVIDAPAALLRSEDLTQEGRSGGKHWGAISM